MRRILWLGIICLTWVPFGHSQPSESCEVFQKLVRDTYNFKPSKLKPADLNQKSTEMDAVWNIVTSNQKQMMPCLRKELEDPSADPWFLFDGSMLLVQIDSSPESWTAEVRGLTVVDLDDVNLRTWISAVAARGADGLDLSEAGRRWLSYPDADYPVPEYTTSVDAAMGALFIYGSMDESIATAALRKIAEDRNHVRRDVALSILAKQATPDSLEILKQMNAAEKPDLIPPRAQPKITREQFVEAFQSAVMDDWRVLQELLDKVPDAEKDMVAVLKPVDIPLLRQVRRRIIATTNPNAVDYYDNFTHILMTMVWK
jgi:hypothetical protein